MNHADAIATLTNATTTTALATALDAFTDLRIGARPGTAPGVPTDAPDGAYQNGYHLLTKTGTQISATAIHDLPDHTLDLLGQLAQEQRDEREQEQLADDLAEERRGRGRPAVGRAIPVRLPTWRIDILDRDAQAAGIGRAELIRALISHAYRTVDRDAQATGLDRATVIRGLTTDHASR